ncbi:MAG: TetR/AcrR family transcriptional regulator [Streptosporangiaceae bacterium]
MAVKRLRERQAEATRGLLVSVARQLFTERGYAGTSIEDIIERAGVARGALYHHFPGKNALFAAVYQVVQTEVATAVVTAALAADDPAQAVYTGLSAFLDACLQPEFRQIVVLDSVPVLQRKAWEEAGTEKHSERSEHSELDMLSQVLTPMAAAYLPGLDMGALTHVALGGLYGAALYIALSPEPATARAQADAVLHTLITGLRTGAGPATARPGPT